MSVICFASLKGGVGKTSVSVNVADAFAHRGCMTLIIDLDPSGHASRLFFSSELKHLFPDQAPLAKAFLPKGTNSGAHLDPHTTASSAFVLPVRPSLELLPGGKELRCFVPAHGGRYFVRKFPALLEELKLHYDHIIIDTPPDFNVLTRNAIACADLVVSPVDMSEMGVHSVEELLGNAKSFKKPIWSILRTMVDNRAQRTKVLSSGRLEANLVFSKQSAASPEFDITNNEELMAVLRGWEQEKSTQEASVDRTVHLLNALVRRSEHQNQLSFLQSTAFDSKKTAALARQYLAVAQELEDILFLAEEEEWEAEMSTGHHQQAANS